MKSKISNTKECYVCRSTYNIEKHHIFGASNRNNSEKYGLWLYLCREHHTGNSGVHFNKPMMDFLHQVGQQTFETEHTREDFMRIFGKNYL